MRDLLLLAAVLVASTTSFAQQAVSGALNGRTMDRTTSPLPGVTVTATGTYHQWDDAYRMPVHDGRLSWSRTDWSQVANGDSVEEVLNKLRATLSQKSPPP